MNEEVNNNVQPVMQQVQPQTVQPVEQPKKGNKTLIIVLAIVGGFVLLIVAVIAMIVLLFSSDKKLVCTSKEGSITINYDDKTIKSYTAVGVTYEFDEQKKYAEQIGTEAYMKEFTNWFETHTSGTCVYK